MKDLKPQSPLLSVVVCVYNEEQNVSPLITSILKELGHLDFELIYVDDGSTDQTVAEVKKFDDFRIRLIELKKNYGQSSALSAGIEAAKGRFTVLLDGDLQNDPSDIPMMLKMATEEGWDLIAGIRADRRDGMFLRKIPSKIANFIIRRSTGVYIKDYGCTLKLFESELAKSIGLYGELHRFIPVLAALEGASITQINVKHHARKFGNSKYGLSRTSKVVSDLILMVFFKKYMQKPMHLFGRLGILILGGGILIDLYLLVLKIMGNDIWGKPLLILAVLTTLAGIQLITVGLVAELQMRTYFESQNKRPYKIKKTWQGIGKHE